MWAGRLRQNGEAFAAIGPARRMALFKGTGSGTRAKSERPTFAKGEGRGKGAKARAKGAKARGQKGPPTMHDWAAAPRRDGRLAESILFAFDIGDLGGDSAAAVREIGLSARLHVPQ